MAQQATVTYGSGQPLAVLNRLLAVRARVLRESTRDAAVAIGIQICKSLRAATKVAKASVKTADYTITDTGYYQGWYSNGGRATRCARAENNNRSTRIPEITNIRALDSKIISQTRLPKIYKIVPTFHRLKSGCYYVSAYSKSAANKFAKAKIKSQKMRYRGLAKTAVGVMMAKLSSRGNFAAATGAKFAIANRLAGAVSMSQSGQFGLQLYDKFNYAKSALKISLRMAMAKAANSVAGYLRRKVADPLKIKTPFPDLSASGKLRN